MRVWRCTKARRLGEAFSGEAGRVTSGRWHSKGVPVVYTSESAALAALEMAVNAGDIEKLVQLYLLVPADVPDELVQSVEEAALPVGWQAYPHPMECQQLGDDWLRAGRTAALRVPSAVVPGFNLILNPLHRNFRRIQVQSEEARQIAVGRRKVAP